MADIVQLVPKVAAGKEGDASEQALGAVKLAVEVLERYLATGEAKPHRVIVVLSSDLPNGGERAEYITGGVGRYTSLGMLETVKHEILTSE